MRKLRKGQLIEVTFLDVASDASWQTEEERLKSKPTVCTCIGHVSHQTADILYLCSMITGTAGDKHEIPIGCISEIWAMSYIGKQPIWRRK